jgi:hypothetical protein
VEGVAGRRRRTGGAMGGLGQYPSRSVSEVLPPLPGAARRARNLLTHACVQWDAVDLLAAACLVATELVTNAARHAQTMLELRVTLQHRRMLIEVGDGCPAPPVLPDPAVIAAYRHHPAVSRGLLVAANAARWGHRHVEGGKIVWAVLRRDDPVHAGSAATAAPAYGPVTGCRTDSRQVRRGAHGDRGRPGAARRRPGRCC